MVGLEKKKVSYQKKKKNTGKKATTKAQVGLIQKLKALRVEFLTQPN